MNEERDPIAAWVAREILPIEGRVRGWFIRRWGQAVDVDDVIQEAYCRIAGLSSVEHIASPIAYFRKTVHGVAADIMRRSDTKKRSR